MVIKFILILSEDRMYQKIVKNANIYDPRRKTCPYSELFWSAFSRIRTEYGEIWSISPYSGQMEENTERNNSKYGHFLRSDHLY